MSVTPQLKAMVEARVTAEADAVKEVERASRNGRGVAAIMEMIDRAATFMDEGSARDKWAPSVKLKLTYFVCATSPYPGGQRRGLEFVEKMLVRSRELWTAGFVPDPWLEDAELIRLAR